MTMSSVRITHISFAIPNCLPLLKEFTINNDILILKPHVLYFSLEPGIHSVKVETLK